MRYIMEIMFMILVMTTHVNSFVGITWGRQQSQQLVPSMVVDLLLQNKIPSLRLMTSASDIVQIFSSTNISIAISLGNRNVNLIKSKALAYEWINDKVKIPIDKGVKIVEVCVGAEPFSNTYLKDAANYQVMNVARIIRDALDEMNLRYVSATIANGMDVITVGKVPSEADFRDDIKGLMLESLEFFNRTSAPFLLNLFPVQMVRDVLNYPIEFTFFNNTSNFKIQDGNVTYTNAVDLMIDSVVWAIRKAGYPDMKIMIGQIGWPTDGYPYANLKNAERFHKGLLKYIASKKGTPLRPGPIDTYLHSLSDETEFRTKFGAFQRHWGIYEADGSPKYKIDFSLQDRDEYPTQAKGIVSMPHRWCMFNGDKNKMDLAKKNYNFACEEADCTRLEEGASCGELSDQSKISYAFNAYFQKHKQNEQHCHFDGLGKITTINPSQVKCEFPIEILAFQDQVAANGMILLKV